MITSEALDYLKNPDSESEVVKIIRKYLLSMDEKTKLFRMDLSIEDCLNGRYGEKEEKDVYEMYDNWNKLCGKKMFGF